MHGGPSGFHNAPLTRTIVTTSAIVSIVHGFTGRSFRLGLSQDIIQNRHLWRVLPSVFAFSSSPELIFGLYLLYYFRVFERQIGSNKYAVFVLFSGVFSTAFEILTLVLLKDPKLSTLASGPYGLIFASFVPFFFDIPVTSRFHILGLNFSNKTGIYLAGLQLLLSRWKQSFLPGICGLLAGSLYCVNAFGIRRLKFPEKVASFFSRLFVSSSASSSRIPNTRTQFSGNRQGQRNPSAAHITVTEPPESSIAVLVSMGFDSNAARQALMRARNDLAVATNILLEAQSR